VATSEEAALGLLLIGDTNRAVAETSMNAHSSRSHCVFTVHVESRAAGAPTVCRSKLQLVDLAGSERVAKTGASGSTLGEAKHINVSLHFLELVIMQLHQAKRKGGRGADAHVPYRNSLLTSVLRGATAHTHHWPVFNFSVPLYIPLCISSFRTCSAPPIVVLDARTLRTIGDYVLLLKRPRRPDRHPSLV
jgi:hypothetical protein